MLNPNAGPVSIYIRTALLPPLSEDCTCSKPIQAQNWHELCPSHISPTNANNKPTALSSTHLEPTHTNLIIPSEKWVQLMKVYKSRFTGRKRPDINFPGPSNPLSCARAAPSATLPSLRTAKINSPVEPSAVPSEPALPKMKTASSPANAPNPPTSQSFSPCLQSYLLLRPTNRQPHTDDTWIRIPNHTHVTTPTASATSAASLGRIISTST